MSGRMLEMPRNPVAEAFAGPLVPALVLLRRAVTGMWDSDKAAAIDLGVSGGQLSKWLSGKERFGLADLDRWRPLRVAFLALLAESEGFDVWSVDADEQLRRRIATKRSELFVLLEEQARRRERVSA